LIVVATIVTHPAQEACLRKDPLCNETNSGVNLAAKTATNGAGYSVERVGRTELVEAKYEVAQSAYSWPLVPDLALLPGLVKPATPRFQVLPGHPGHPPARYNLCRWTSG
jgi:hypothetical protein